MSLNTYNPVTGKLEPVAGNSSKMALEELTNVNSADLADGDILRYDSASERWTNRRPGPVSLGDNLDVNLTNPANGEMLRYDGTSEKWINSTDTLENITDVNITNIQDGDRIKWDNGTQKWVNGPGAKSDWSETSPSSDAFIANKPTLGDAASSNKTSAVTQSSTDVLTSGGAFTALAGKADNATSLAGYGITNAYTKDEVDELFAEHENNVSWKQAVATYADIATTYPNPQEGWTVCCTDTNIVWRYSGGQWVQITANTIPLASTTENGLMSKAGFTKLNNLPAGAEVNQNAFSNVKVGSTTVAADTKTDTLELVGSNVTLTPDATNDKVTIGITKANVTDALGYTPPTTNTTTGTTYAASSIPANTTFATNGTVKNVYNAVPTIGAATYLKKFGLSLTHRWYGRVHTVRLEGAHTQAFTANSSYLLGTLTAAQAAELSIWNWMSGTDFDHLTCNWGLYLDGYNVYFKPSINIAVGGNIAATFTWVI